MEKLKKLIEQRGYVVTDSRAMGARSRVLQQASSMLEKLGKMTSASDMDSETTTQNWWAPKPREDERRVVVRYSNMVVPDTGIYVRNTLEAVTKAIQDIREAVEETTEADWQVEEDRRKQLKEETQKKNKTSDADD